MPGKGEGPTFGHEAAERLRRGTRSVRVETHHHEERLERKHKERSLGVAVRQRQSGASDIIVRVCIHVAKGRLPAAKAVGCPSVAVPASAQQAAQTKVPHADVVVVRRKAASLRQRQSGASDIIVRVHAARSRLLAAKAVGDSSVAVPCERPTGGSGEGPAC